MRVSLRRSSMQDDIRTGFGKAKRDRRTQATGRSRNQCVLTFNPK